MPKRIEKDERGQGRSSVRLSKLVSEYALGHPRVPSTVLIARRVRETVLAPCKTAERKCPGLHDDMAEGDKSRDRPTSEKVNLNGEITTAVDSTGIKVTNRGECIKEK